MVVFFPEELLISEILVRIPAKELLKFKSVCKRWRFLISDPKFAAEHLRYSKPDNQIIFSINLPDTSHPPLCEVDCYSINMQEITPPEFQRPFKDIFSIKYSCNGMLLLLDMNISCKNLIIYNPVTRVRKDLPPAPKDCINWALVLDASTGKYKVFGITLIDCFVFTQGEIDWMYLHTLALPTFIREEKHRSDLISLENKLYWTEPFRQKNNVAHEEHIQ